jgi:hypothetical protein
LPTEPGASPWWEIDLGKSFAVEEINVWIEPVDPAARVRVSAYSMAAPSGDPPNGCFEREIAAGDLPTSPDGSRVVSLWDEIVARFVRIELVSSGEPVRLGLRGIQVFAADLFADTLAGTYWRAFTLFADRPLFCARREPGQVAFEVTHSYRDVWAMASRLAAALARRLETPDHANEPSGSERVFLGLCTKNRAEWFIAEVAAVIRGYVVVPLSPDDSEERLRAILDRCPVAAVVCESGSVGALARIASEHPKLRLIIGLGERPADGPDARLFAAWKKLFDESESASAPEPPPPRGPLGGRSPHAPLHERQHRRAQGRDAELPEIQRDARELRGRPALDPPLVSAALPLERAPLPARRRHERRPYRLERRRRAPP